MNDFQAIAIVKLGVMRMAQLFHTPYDNNANTIAMITVTKSLSPNEKVGIPGISSVRLPTSERSIIMTVSISAQVTLQCSISR